MVFVESSLHFVSCQMCSGKETLWQNTWQRTCWKRSYMSTSLRQTVFHCWTYPAPLCQWMLMMQKLSCEWYLLIFFNSLTRSEMCIKPNFGKVRHTCHLFNTHILMQFVTCVIEKCIFSLGFNKLVSSCFHRERNNRYAEVCRNRMCNDKYVDRSMQTLNGPAKNKQIQSDCVVMVDTG